MTVTERLTREDVARSLADFEDELRVSLGPLAWVDRTDHLEGRVSTVTVRPVDAVVIGVAWSETLDEVVLKVGQSGRWELDHTVADVDLLKAIVRAVLEGRAVEVHSREGHVIAIELGDGTTAHSIRR